MIKAICFDLDGVFFSEQSFKIFKRKVAEFTKHPDLMDEVFHGSTMNDFKTNTVTEGEYWDYARDTLGMTLANEEIFMMLRKSYLVDPDILNYLCEVKDAGYKTCLCSNNFVTRINELEKEFAFLNHFDIQIFSFDIGVLKPHANIFRALIEQVGVNASEIVYSDDRASKLDGAKELGIHTFVFENINQFMCTLESLGVNIESN